MQPNDPKPVTPAGSPSSNAPAPDGTPVGPGPVGPAPSPRPPYDDDATQREADLAATGTADTAEPVEGADPADDVAKLQQGLRTGLGPQAAKGPDDTHRVTVGDGESLEYILDREGIEADPAELYRANANAIEAAAQARGFGTSDNGRLLFPGTVLELPSR